MRVAYLGPAGTHSEEALRASAPAHAEAIPYPTIYDAVMAVQEGAIDRAIVPIENALEGSVAVTLDTLTLEADRVRIEAEVVHPVHHCVIAGSELSLSTVERVVSHPQATAQCARFLREHLPDAKHVSAPSTADAVMTVCRADDASVALGSSLAAELYHCHIVASNVEDHPDNATRFVWLAPEDQVGEPGEEPKTSIVFWGGGDQSPGWLVDVLNEFAGRGGTFEVHEEEVVAEPGAAGRVDDALGAVREHVEELRVLGSYGRPPWLN